MTISSLLQAVAFPPGLLLIGLMLGAVASKRKHKRLGAALFIIPVSVTIVSSLPWIADSMVEPLEASAFHESREALVANPLPRIAVVLGGMVDAPQALALPMAVGYDLSAAADRVVAAAHLWRTGQIDRIVLSGGLGDSISEAELMARFAQDLGVPREAMVLEGDSRTTRENATQVAQLLRGYDLSNRIALVTSGLHLPRAIREFRCAGLDPIGVPAEFESLGSTHSSLADWMPSSGALDRSRRALKEWVGGFAASC